jgi:outer membrane protein assembly factor BamD
LIKKIIVIVGLFFLTAPYGWGKKEEAVLPAGEQMEKCRALFAKKKWTQAQSELQKMVLNYPGYPAVDTAHMLLGISYFKQELFLLAADEFGKIVTNFSSSPLACQTDFYRSFSRFKLAPKNPAYDQKEVAASVEAFRTFLEEWPTCFYADSARLLLSQALDRLAKKDYSIGFLYFKLRDYEASRIYLQGVIDEFSESNYGPEALYLFARSLEKEKKFAEAKLKYEAFLSIYPDHKRAAEVREKLKKNADLAAVEPKK